MEKTVMEDIPEQLRTPKVPQVRLEHIKYRRQSIKVEIEIVEKESMVVIDGIHYSCVLC